MKKSVIKSVVFAAVFLLSLFVICRIMNKGHDNLTVEMAPASLPLVSMELNGTAYNQLHGYVQTMDTAFQRDTVTVLGKNRDTDFRIDTYGAEVTRISIEVRNLDGSRLIENTEVTEYETRRGRIQGRLALKDLIDSGGEYSLALILELEGSREVYYYTKAVWSDSLHAEEKLAYVVDFHQRLYDREAARELTKYLETNARLEDNSSFHKVNIHSSFRQITWGELNVREIGEPVYRLKEIAGQTASFLVDYMVSTSEGKETTYYMVEEYYRIRYSAERMYLLDYERTMTQIPDPAEMYGNDKILLGITGTDVPMRESEDGNILVFEAAGGLFSYDITTNRLAVLFRFYDEDNADARTLYGGHSIKILDVDEGGNVQFAVYGYMNRGRHEGEVGVQVCTYNSSLNTVEELIYIPSDKTWSVLEAEIDRLLYLNREGLLYLQWNDMVYGINLSEKVGTRIVDANRSGSLRVSENHRIIIWSEEEDIYHSGALNIRNLNNDRRSQIQAAEGEALLPLAFMDEDIIYGTARMEDIRQDSSGRIFFPMYKISICDSGGELLKEYSQPDIYMTGCTVEENQIVLERLRKREDGTYQEIEQDHIMNSVETKAGKNVVVAADIDIYERYVQIRIKSDIDVKNIKILTPKEVVYEGGRILMLPTEQKTRYYVYGPYGVDGIFDFPAEAVNLASDTAGVVINDSGRQIWLRGNRVTRNQIMAIKEPEKTEAGDSLAACLDTIFRYEGLVRNSEYLLAQGKTVPEILEENLDGAEILDMTGCSLDDMLYFVNQDLPVLALLENGEAVLVTGFNEYNVVIMEPSTGRLYKKGMNDSAAWFEENGNTFITYLRRE
ncbi:MAG: hypothetical protein NC432_10470 [Roseburia sp.]|nr:hypothetical protein [Roseburia sp.]MCM1099201.1 hypothetical protein [Ruminococcus flavefaciens]